MLPTGGHLPAPADTAGRWHHQCTMMDQHSALEAATVGINTTGTYPTYDFETAGLTLPIDEQSIDSSATPPPAALPATPAADGTALVTPVTATITSSSLPDGMSQRLNSRLQECSILGVPPPPAHPPAAHPNPPAQNKMLGDDVGITRHGGLK